ncbi:MAG: hypothetical protein R3E12_20360 [Candidatus Eisenbacteria bacterium]
MAKDRVDDARAPLDPTPGESTERITVPSISQPVLTSDPLISA